MPFDPHDELDMRFTVAEWNQVLRQLQEGKYKRMAPLINKINMQAAQHEAQRQAAAEASAIAQQQPAAPIGYTNGEIHEPQLTDGALSG